MKKYTVDAVMAFLAHISPIPSYPTFSTLWELANCLYESLSKIKTPDCPGTGHAGYMIPTVTFNSSPSMHGLTCQTSVIASSCHPHSSLRLTRNWQ